MEGPEGGEYITEEMRVYEPCDQDIFISIKSGDYQRLIWGGKMQLRGREVDHQQKFMEFIAKSKKEQLPEVYLTEDRLAMRFLQGCFWKHENAYK